MLIAPNLTYVFPGTVRTWHAQIFPKRGVFKNLLGGDMHSYERLLVYLYFVCLHNYLMVNKDCQNKIVNFGTYYVRVQLEFLSWFSTVDRLLKSSTRITLLFFGALAIPISSVSLTALPIPSATNFVSAPRNPVDETLLSRSASTYNLLSIHLR